jgi:hypothetical protein
VEVAIESVRVRSGVHISCVTDECHENKVVRVVTAEARTVQEESTAMCRQIAVH